MHRDRESQPEFLNFVLWAGQLYWEFPQIVMHSAICFRFQWNILFRLGNNIGSHSSKLSTSAGKFLRSVVMLEFSKNERVNLFIIPHVFVTLIELNL